MAMVDVNALLRRLHGDPYVLRSILLVMIAAASPLLVLVGYNALEARKDAEQRAYAVLKARADRAAQEVQSALDQADHLVAFMAGRERLQALDPNACNSLVRGVAAPDSLYTNVGLFDALGNAVCTAVPRAVRTNFADSSWFREGFAKGDLYLSPEQRGALSGKRVMYLTRPVISTTGEKVGLIALALDLDALNQRLHFLGGDGFSVTVRQGRRILMRVPMPERWVGQPVPEHILNAPDLPTVPVKIAPGLEGKMRAFTVTPIPRYALESVAGMPERAVYEEAHQAAWRSAFIAAAALLLGLVTAWAAARRLVLSVESVGETASRLRAGESNVSADTRLPSVFGDVAREFNRLIDVSLQRTTDLERVAFEAVRLRRFYQALSETGQAIARHADKSELFAVVCSACTKGQLANGAWLIEHTSEGWVIAARAHDGTMVPEEVALIGLAQRAGRRSDPWVERLPNIGETAVLPLGADSPHPSVLVLVAQTPGWFDAEIAMLLAELGRDLSMGLDLQLARGRQRALVAAEASNQAKSSFLSHVSHELRTPLNAVVGFAQLSAERPAAQTDEALQSYLRHVLTAARHLKLLIDDLLDVSRIDLGKLTVEFVDVDVAELVRTAAELQKPAASEHGVSVKLISTTPTQLWMQTDPGRLRQVLTNLVSNAIKYNRPGGEVRVGVHREEGAVCIRVQDNGQGMSDAQLDGLFVAFNRLGRERSSVEGTGIGLFITKKVVELLGGHLTVKSRVDVGTTVTVALTDRPPATDHLERHAVQPVGRSEADQLAGLSGTVLYIEDNPVNALLVQQWFRVHTHADVVVAETGADGVSIARQRRPDLVLLDMQLPDMHGLQVLRALKDADATSHLPVVALSANAMREDVEAARREGVVDYWAKPIDFDTMAQGVLRLLGNRRTSQSGTLPR